MKRIVSKMSVFVLGIFICLCIFSCGNRQSITQSDKIEIYKYKGYKVAKKLAEGSTDWDEYVLKNDSVAVRVKVPAWFSDLYSEGDTIK